MYRVIKRDGSSVDFEISKISAAMIKAFEALEKKHYKDFEAMMSYFHSFVIVTRKDAGDEFGTPSIGINLRPDEEPREPPLVIYSRRFSVLEPKSMKVIIDGSLYEADEANKMLDMNMVEYVELLTPIKALKYIPGAIDGAIFIKTKGYGMTRFYCTT